MWCTTHPIIFCCYRINIVCIVLSLWCALLCVCKLTILFDIKGIEKLAWQIQTNTLFTTVWQFECENMSTNISLFPDFLYLKRDYCRALRSTPSYQIERGSKILVAVFITESTSYISNYWSYHALAISTWRISRRQKQHHYKILVIGKHIGSERTGVYLLTNKNKESLIRDQLKYMREIF